jgi:murein L,D-transpeptidase YcbB/YkuD
VPRAGAVLLWVTALAAGARVGAAQDSLVTRFYSERGYRLAWSDAGGVSPQAVALLAIVLRADADGLDPADYRSPALDSVLHPPRTIFEAWRVDSLVTGLFFRYARDLSRGRVDPARTDSQWSAAARDVDLVRLLETAIDSGHVAATLYDLAPSQPGYVALRRALARYRDLAALGDWPAEPATRLAAEGYDTARGLSAAVRAFQAAHGIPPDGNIGPATRAALDLPAAARARQIALNLERWRWLPRELGERYIMVNSAAFSLDLVDRGATPLTMRAIVGRPDWPTPIASSRATHLLFRPPWNVPRSIAVQEVLPLLQRDTGYRAREGMHVFGDSTLGAREIAPDSIDWRSVTDSTFTYQLVQEPGPDNPLGGVKLVFWTPFNVFIHDTPARPLFSEPWRAFSHGCVRVEHAADLAAALLPEWPMDSIREAMSRGRERWVRIPAAIPVHLVYWTAWAEGEGPVQFRDDTYGWDQRLADALAAASPPVARVT